MIILLSFIEKHRQSMLFLAIFLIIMGVINPHYFIAPALVAYLLSAAGYGIHWLLRKRY